MEVRKCDRCGKIYEVNMVATDYRLRRKSMPSCTPRCFHEADVSVDLCDECLTMLDIFLNNPNSGVVVLDKFEKRSEVKDESDK